jgi:plastocyanin
MYRQLAATAALLTFLLAGSVPPAEAAVIQVTVAEMAFSPVDINANVGDTIEWDNKDFVAHTATARDKSFDVLIPAHGKGTLVLETAGTFDYFCRFHPMMKGKIIVTDSATTTE